MDHTEIYARLAEIEKNLADRGFAPFAYVMMEFKSESCWVSMSTGWLNDAPKLFENGKKSNLVVAGETPQEALAEAFAIIAALPDPDTAAKRAAVAQYGKAVDALHDAGFDDVVMIPVRETMAALTSNLLTYEGDGK